MLMVSCQKENETVEVLTPNVTLESTERTCVAGCQQCSIQDFCCCIIEVRDPTGIIIEIQLCGDLPGCTGIDTCTVSAMGNCPEIRGILAVENLISTSPFFYCQKEDEAIRLTNLETFDILVRITCGDPDSLGPMPPSTEVLIPSLGSKSIFVDSDCEAEECN